MADRLRIALAQINVIVGDVVGNTNLMRAEIRNARDLHGAHMILFPELALCGYPPEDLLFHSGLAKLVADAMRSLAAEASGIAVVVGYPEFAEGKIYNAAAWLEDGELRGNYRKRCLPNYGVFDEARYFAAGNEPLVLSCRGVRIGVTICEDNWEDSDVAVDNVAAGAELLVSINGSPFELTKQEARERRLAERAVAAGVPVVYQNLVGGQDELVFDGGSCVLDAAGQLTQRAPAFATGLYMAVFEREATAIVPLPGELHEVPGAEELIYTAIKTAVHDYVHKNGFSGIVLGLSGGVDSALCLGLAVDALGADSVQAVMMPYTYTSAMSLEDAAQQAKLLGVSYQMLPIADMVNATTSALAELFAGLPADATEENIQARCRGILLMAISNKTRRIVLTTGNKSEMAVGYATLYGDMAGGFAPIKDCTKTLVYRLARYRNTLSPCIPPRVIEREPSAELRPDQKDSDSLPDYAVLDAILDALMIADLSVDEIAALGYDRELVGRVLSMVRRNEYKRRQSPPGVRISGRAFGRDWRYPITSGYGRD